MSTHYINGQWRSGRGTSFDSVNPCTQEVIWTGRTAGESDVDTSVNLARRAFPIWRDLSFDTRCNFVKRYQSSLKENSQSLAEIISLETGKPIWESLAEVAAMTGKVDLSIQAFLERSGESTRESDKTDGSLVSRVAHRPHGVVVVFGPYNFPGHLPNGHIVPALLAGNTVILKPSEQTPLVAQAMIELLDRAELPPGVVNLIQGARETSIALASHPGVDGIFFTGSSATGAIIERQLVGSRKILALEMGGNNPLVVWDVEDHNAAVYHILQSAYLTAGQRCTCARRLIVSADSPGNQLIDRLCETIDSIVIGPPKAKPTPFMGPIISNDAADQLLHAQSVLTDLGGQILVGLKRTKSNLPFLSPGLIDLSDASDVPDEEHFGPLLSLYRVNDFDEAIRLANTTRFGLAAGLLSDQPKHWSAFYRQIRAGIVNWNRPLTGASSAAPFGGIGASGNHRPSAYYAADYCAYPVATLQDTQLRLPEGKTPGLRS